MRVQKRKTTKEKIGVCFLVRSTLGQRGMLELQDGDYDECQVGQLFTRTCTNQTISWLVCGWNIFGARMRHEHTWIHNIHHNPKLGETITFPLIVFFVPRHKACTQMLFCFKIDILAILEGHNFLCKPPIEVRFKAKLQPSSRAFQ